MRAAADPATNNLRYPGQYYDAETGLHYNDRRYYDPDTGRYTTRDPIGFEGGINLYTYAAASPANFTDPTGEFAFLIPVAEAAVQQYLRCMAKCNLEKAAKQAWNRECVNLGDNAKDCALDCLNPLNWGGKGGKWGAKDWRKKPGSLGKSKGTDALRRENETPRKVANELGLTKDQKDILHTELQKESQDLGRPLTYQETLDLARDLFGK